MSKLLFKVQYADHRWWPWILAAAGLAATATPASAQPNDDGLRWVTVGNANNRPYDRTDQSGLVTGRGSVPWQYRMTQSEVPASLWVEFLNASRARADAIDYDFGSEPWTFGIVFDPTYTGPGRRYQLSSAPNAANMFVADISWRTCAVLCNWLHNDKRLDREAFLTGAYEVSQFWDGPNAGVGGEQASHNPGAKYWIPTLDEWLKASYYDPTKNGTGGWWQSPDASDRVLVGGRPGVADFNGGGSLPFWERSAIPLESYGHIRSYYGLYDVLGGTAEYLEDQYLDGRLTAGTAAEGPGGYQLPDYIGGAYSRVSDITNGLRLASAVPNVGTCVIVMVGLLFPKCKRRRMPW